MGEPAAYLIVGPSKKLVPIYKVETSSFELEDATKK
jgi:hypothetical protein